MKMAAMVTDMTPLLSATLTTPIENSVNQWHLGDKSHDNHMIVAKRIVHACEWQVVAIRESVDSLCRDDADMPMPPYIGKACNRPNAAFVSLFR